MELKTYILIFFVLAGTQSLQAQKGLEPENIKTQNITVKDGLSQSNINDIIKDRQGFIWIATDEGLNRFDSYEFKIFKHNLNDSTSLSDNKVWCLLEDSKGNIWAGTNQGGLNLFDKKTNTFRHFTHDPADENTITGSGVYCLLEAENNILWVGTLQGLCAFDVKNNRIKRYTNIGPEGKTIRDLRVHAIMEDRSGRIWVGSNGGVSVVNPVTDSITSYSYDPQQKNSLSADRVRAIYQDSEGKIWIGTDGGGVNLLNEDQETFTRFTHNPYNKNSVSSDIIREIFEDSEGNIWFGTDGSGISVYLKKEGRFRQLESKDDPSLVNAAVYKLLKDNDEILWIGTYGDGLKVLNLRRKNFIHYEYFNDVMAKLGKNSILSIAEDSEKNVWLGTDGAGLFKYDRRTKSFSHFLHSPSDKNSLSSNVIKSLMVDRNDNVYAGTYAGGLNIYNPKTGKFTCFKPDPNNVHSINSYHVWSLLQDSKGRIWVGTLGGGLDEFLPEKKLFIHHINDKNDSTTISVNFVSKMLEDSQGNLWIATEDGGVNKLDPENRTFRRFMYQASRKPNEGLSNNFVRDIFEDSQGRLWVGTNGGGLNYFDPKSENFKVLAGPKELNEAILGILEDENGFFWISTYSGIYKFNPESLDIRAYDLYDGLQGNEFNANAKLKSSDGYLYFGGLNGLNIFRPEEILENSSTPPIVLTKFYLFHNEVEISGKDLPADINQLNRISLEPGQNVFSFKYAALDFVFPKKNKYAYKLEGFDDDWNMVERERIATYTNIPPGDYILKVIGSNNDGVWNEIGKQLHVQVLAPWYEKAYARVLLLFVVIILVISIFKIRTRILRNQKRKLEDLVKLRTRQIEIQKTEIEKKSHALKEQNAKIMLQNEQLKNKNEEIFFQKEQVREKSQLLEKAHVEIKKANDELKTINSDLEKLVDTRTHELRETLQKLIKTDEELNLFIYRSSHDLRGPITSLLGLSQLTRREAANEKLEQYFNLIDSACLNMLKLLKKLNDANLVFKSEKNISKIFWNQVINDVVANLKILDPKSEVKTEIDNQINQVVYSDPFLIEIIILNLMENSIVFKSRKKLTREVKLVLKLESGSMKIIVRDNGKGIEPKIQDKLFGLFYRGSEASNGTGLGLYLVQKAVHLLNGKIRLDSQVNEYTEFEITIPVTDKPPKCTDEPVSVVGKIRIDF